MAVAAIQLSGEFGPATGCGDYNSTISYWCPAGADPKSTITWDAFAKVQGHDPDWWPLLSH